MLLVEWTMNGILHRISNEYLTLEHPWKAKIKAFDVHYRINQNHGGYCAMNVGNIVLVPDFFSTDWPPPLSADITVKQTSNNEASAVTLFSGKAHWAGQERGNITYTPYGQNFTAAVVNNKLWSTQTLKQIMTTMCSSDGFNLSFSSFMARTPSPEVVHQMESERLAVDFADDLCAYYSHMFYVEGNTLYLVDMLTNNSSRNVGFKFFPPQYSALRPIAIATVTTQSNLPVSVKSTYAYGEEVNFIPYHTSTAKNSSALTDIVEALNKRRVSVTLPSTVSRIKPGERLSIVDTRFPVNLTAKINARDIHYDWGNKRITVTGEGTLTT